MTPHSKGEKIETRLGFWESWVVHFFETQCKWRWWYTLHCCIFYYLISRRRLGIHSRMSLSNFVLISLTSIFYVRPNLCNGYILPFSHLWTSLHTSFLDFKTAGIIATSRIDYCRPNSLYWNLSVTSTRRLFKVCILQSTVNGNMCRSVYAIVY